MKRIIVIIAGFLLFVPLTLADVARAGPPAVAVAAGPGTAQADTVTQWNLTMIAGLEAAGIPPPPPARSGAGVQAAGFHAVEGSARRDAPHPVAPAGPPGAPGDAAAAAAAHPALAALIPGQKPLFDAQLSATLAQLSDDPSRPGQAVRRGLAWGQTVANNILAWRADDGFTAPPPPYAVGSAPRDWQPTPPPFLRPPAPPPRPPPPRAVPRPPAAAASPPVRHHAPVPAARPPAVRPPRPAPAAQPPLRPSPGRGAGTGLRHQHPPPPRATPARDLLAERPPR